MQVLNHQPPTNYWAHEPEAHLLDLQLMQDAKTVAIQLRQRAIADFWDALAKRFTQAMPKHLGKSFQALSGMLDRSDKPASASVHSGEAASCPR